MFCEKINTVIKKMSSALTTGFQIHLYLALDNLVNLTQPHVSIGVLTPFSNYSSEY